VLLLERLLNRVGNIRGLGSFEQHELYDPAKLYEEGRP
jgi:hypothetical protein